MCECLLRLHPYFSLMEADGQLKKNLTNAQWMVVKDTTALLESFSSCKKMNSRFEEQWGCVDPGTAATEHLTEGPRRWPKGIPRLALVASVVDPRFKFGPGFSEFDKTYIWNIIRQMMTYIAVGANQREEEPLLEEGNQQR
jgi:hypothetical protein